MNEEWRGLARPHGTRTSIRGRECDDPFRERRASGRGRLLSHADPANCRNVVPDPTGFLQEHTAWQEESALLGQFDWRDEGRRHAAVSGMAGA